MDNNTIVDDNTDKNKKNLKIFKNNHILVRMSFIIGSVVLSSSIIFFVLFSAIKNPYINTLYIALAIIAAVALIGLIISSLSFGKGRNIYSILGFIFSLFVIVYHVIVICLFADSGI